MGYIDAAQLADAGRADAQERLRPVPAAPRRSDRGAVSVKVLSHGHPRRPHPRAAACSATSAASSCETFNAQRVRGGRRRRPLRAGQPLALGAGHAARAALPGAQRAGQAGAACIAGAVFDVAVDVRRARPTFGKWVGVELSARQPAPALGAPGLRPRLLVLSESADFAYKCTAYYAPEDERQRALERPGPRHPLAACKAAAPVRQGRRRAAAEGRAACCPSTSCGWSGRASRLPACSCTGTCPRSAGCRAPGMPTFLPTRGGLHPMEVADGSPGKTHGLEEVLQGPEGRMVKRDKVSSTCGGADLLRRARALPVPAVPRLAGGHHHRPEAGAGSWSSELAAGGAQGGDGHPRRAPQPGQQQQRGAADGRRRRRASGPPPAAWWR